MALPVKLPKPGRATQLGIRAKPAPVFTSPAAATVDELTTLVHTVTAYDAWGAPLAFSIAGSGPDDSLFHITTGGVLSFITAPDFESPSDAGGDNIYNVDVSVTDGAIIVTQSIAVTVVNVDENPTAVNDAYTVIQGSTTVLNLASNDTDPEGDLDLTSINIISGPSKGSLLDNNDGTVSYTNTSTGADTDTFTYTISDAGGAVSNQATVDITVEANTQTLLSLWRDTDAPNLNPVTPAGINTTLPPANTARYVEVNDGGANTILYPVPAGAMRWEGCRPIRNIATALTTHSITVVSGRRYQVTIAGDNGAQVVCSNAFSTTIVADGVNRKCNANGTVNTATTTTLTLTVTGTLTQLQVEDVTPFTNQLPAEHVPITGADPSSGIAGLKWSIYENGNTVDGNGVVTEAQGALIPASQRPGVLMEGAGGNQAVNPQNPELWTNWGGMTHGGRNTTGVDGKLSAITAAATLSTSNHGYYTPSAGQPVGTVVTEYMIIKRSNHDYVQVRGDAPSSVYVNVNLSTNTITQYGAGVTGSGVMTLENGFVAVWLTYARTSTASANIVVQIIPNATHPANTAWLSAGTEKVIVWGLQTYAEPVPTSFTDLTSRAADNDIKLTLADFGFDGTTDGTINLTTKFKHDFADLPASDLSLISLNGETGAALLYHKANHKLAVFDGTTSMEATTTIVKDTEYAITITWVVGDNMTIYVNDMQVGQVPWDNNWNAGTLLEFAKGYSYGVTFKNVSYLDGVAA